MGQLNADVRDQVKGLPEHKKTSLKVFLDISTEFFDKKLTNIASEAYIMLSHNHALKWLKRKSEAEV